MPENHMLAVLLVARLVGLQIARRVDPAILAVAGRSENDAPAEIAALHKKMLHCTKM